jgi:hypothetical protein
MEAILWDRLPIAKVVNVKVISLDQAPEGYKEFDTGVANKFVIDPHGMLPKAADHFSIACPLHAKEVAASACRQRNWDP